MKNVMVNIDIEKKGGSFFVIHLDYGFPGCGCQMRSSSAISVGDPVDAVEGLLAKVDREMRIDTFCPICKSDWTKVLPYC